MEKITTETFLEWAAKRGVVPDTRYSQPERGAYILRCDTGADPAESDSRVWNIPRETEDHQQDEVALYYVSSALTSLDPWQTMGLMKRESRWFTASSDPWEAALLEPLGVPEGYEGALFFDRSEFASLYSISLMLSVCGWCSSFDAFVVPDHGQQIVCFDNDVGIIGKFASEAARDRYTERLRTKEIESA